MRLSQSDSAFAYWIMYSAAPLLCVQKERSVFSCPRAISAVGRDSGRSDCRLSAGLLSVAAWLARWPTAAVRGGLKQVHVQKGRSCAIRYFAGGDIWTKGCIGDSSTAFWSCCSVVLSRFALSALFISMLVVICFVHNTQ